MGSLARVLDRAETDLAIDYPSILWVDLKNRKHSGRASSPRLAECKLEARRGMRFCVLQTIARHRR
jgi:hypothetical protein